jgi:hypothetical protein
MPPGPWFAQAIGRALPPTARTLDLWLITGGRPSNIGAGQAALAQFHLNALVIADPDAWSFTVRSLVQQAQATGAQVSSGNGPYVVDGVTLSLAADGRGWLIQTPAGRIIVVAPETSWLSLPADVHGAIFASGGPAEWQGPGQGFSVIEVDRNSRDGLPCAPSCRLLAGLTYRTDQLGTVGFTQLAHGFQRSSD